MILQKIVLSNVGLYREFAEFDLTPTAERRLILIGGLNGGGKTTLLESVHLGLYGRRANVVERTRRSYQELLRTLIHRRANPAEGSSIEIQFQRVVQGRTHEINVVRRWAVNPKDEVVESVEARRDGVFDDMLSQQWDEYIEGYLPARLAPLFFFDGEQVEELAHPDAAASLISLAVQSLLGLDLVDRLRDDLAVLARRKRMAGRSATEREQLEKLKAAHDASEANVTAICDEQARNKSELERVQREQAQLRQRFAAEGGELHLGRAEMEGERAKTAKALSGVENEIRSLADGPSALLVALSLLDETEHQADRELAVGHQKIIFEAEVARDRLVIDRLKKKFNREELAVVDTVLRDTRPQLPLETEQILASDAELPEQLRALRDHVLPRLQREIEEKTREARKLGRKVDDLDRQLARVPDEDQLARIQQEMKKLEVEFRDADHLRIALEDRRRLAEHELKLRKNELTKLLETAHSELAAVEHDQRILDRIPHLDTTLTEFRRRVVAKHAGHLERLILESFQQLVRKPLLVKEVRINPDNFHLELTSGDGRLLPIDRLSAGERQLLATSILWGLAKASGRPVPTIIDTPLGRLDSSHRDHLVQRYFPVASHQVVLLSTDQEIDATRLAQLDPIIVAKYTLNYDAKQQRTTVEKGYFNS